MNVLTGLRKSDKNRTATDEEIVELLRKINVDDVVKIRNVRIHNLKGIDVNIPRNKLTVITGVFGSGKSSLAFDTLYEEGKRRYLIFSDTQFMVDSAPSFDGITGLSPTVAVELQYQQRTKFLSTIRFICA